MFSMITNIYNKKTKGPTLMELFTATGKLKKGFLTTRHVRCVHHWAMLGRTYFPPLPRDLADLKARIIAAVKHIDVSMLTVCGKNLNIVSMCAVSPVVHTSNISSSHKKLFQFSCGCEHLH
jgi:hypothetical protein